MKPRAYSVLSAQVRRLGFMAGQISVPDDFDQIGKLGIADKGQVPFASLPPPPADFFGGPLTTLRPSLNNASGVI